MKTSIVITILALLGMALLIGIVLIRLISLEKKQNYLDGKREKYTYPNANQNKK
jgi:hypothetical protein